MKKIGIIILSFFICGCATTLKTSPTFNQTITKVKTIAVMPPDIKVYKLTAGGVRELIDEWSDGAKRFTSEALQEHLAKRYGYKINFFTEDWLKQNHKELWQDNRALYEAVSYSILLHAYPGPNVFANKKKNFDYTLGEGVGELSRICQADALLFIRGIDHEATAGRIILTFWNMAMGAVTGVYYIPLNPCAMDIALIDGKSGDIQWYKVTPSNSDYSFRDKRTISKIIEWLVRDLLEKK